MSTSGLWSLTAEMFRWLRQLVGPQTTGAVSERAAELWLRRNRQFVVVARNWRNPHDRREEIDLVCLDAGILVFVEVKARAKGALVPGFYAIDRRKKQALRRAVRAYLRGLRERPQTYRFDVVEICLGVNQAPEEVLHFENVSLE